MDTNPSTSTTKPLRPRIGIALGPAIALVLLLIGPADGAVEALGGLEAARSAWVVLALLALMAIWWVTEAVPIPVTSLLPLIVLPMAGVASLRDVSAEYMHPVVVLLMGGFIFAKTVERWGLHKRIALNVVVRAGRNPTMLVGGFMVAAALLSMWISNTATSIMMMPIAMSVAAALSPDGVADRSIAIPLILGIAYACSIGGLATPIGTPTNLIVIGYLEDRAGINVDFASWMMLGVPTVLCLVPMAWFVLTRWAFPVHRISASGGQAEVRSQLNALGPVSAPEARTFLVFLVVATLWMFNRPLVGLEIAGFAPFAGLNNAITAVIAAVLPFLVPSGRRDGGHGALLDWKNAEMIPWGVVLLFGGGLALADAIALTGLGAWLGNEMAFIATLPLVLLVVVIATVVIFTTEVTSNVATASALTPVLGAVALASGLDVAVVIAPLALAASCAFMLPMATGPNAVAFATGNISLPTMASAGFRINLLAIPIITLIVVVLAPLVFSS